MKNFKVSFGILFAFFTILVSCEKQDDESIIDIEQNTSEITIEILNQSQVESNLKVFEKIERFVAPNTKSSKGVKDTIYSNEYGFYIDTDYVKYIEKGDYHSYNFNIIRDNPLDDKLENLVLTLNENGGYDALLLKYDFTSEELLNLNKDDLNNRATQYISINFDTSFLNKSSTSKTEIICEEQWYFVAILSPRDNEISHYQLFSEIVCSGGGGPGPTSGDATSGTTSGGDAGEGGSPSSTSGTGTAKTYYTAPTSYTMAEELAVYLGTLTEEQILWANKGLNSRKVQELINYLKVGCRLTDKGGLACDDAKELAFLEIETYMNPTSEMILTRFNFNLLTNNCARDVVIKEILEGTDSGLINLIFNMFNNDAEVDLDIRNTDSIPSIANASTSVPSDSKIAAGNYQISIGLSNDFLDNNPTKLAIALVTIHEMVHAKLIYHYLHGNLLNEYPQFSGLKEALDQFINNRSKENELKLNDAMHVAMVDLIGTMSYSLYKYAQHVGMNNVTKEYCSEITKGTFYNTPGMQLIDTGNKTPLQLNNIYLNEQNNTVNAIGDDC